jgi:hypothetical protein
MDFVVRRKGEIFKNGGEEWRGVGRAKGGRGVGIEFGRRGVGREDRGRGMDFGVCRKEEIFENGGMEGLWKRD